MQFRILGPLEAWENGQEVDLGSGRQLALLVFLLLQDGEVVSSARLVDELWDERAPPSAAKMLQSQVSRLRRLLPADSIVTRDSGYLLRAGETDAVEFERLLELARGQPAGEAAATLRAALALWRGPPLSGFEYETWAQPELARLEELRLVALEERVEGDLQLGGAKRLIPELEALVAEHPLREVLRAELMLALYRSGRQADALETYTDARRRLVDELGIEPGPELQELQRQILAHDPALGPTPRPRPLARVARRGRWLALAGVVLLLAAAAAVAAALLWGGESPQVAGIAANSVGFIDARGRLTRTQISVGAAPTSAAFGAGALWVANANANTVSRVDLRTKSVETIPGVGDSPSGIAVGGGGVWVADHDDDTVAWINPATNTVVKEIGVGDGPTAVAYGDGSVWVTNSNDRSLTRINPDTGVPSKAIPVNATGRGIAVGGGYVWVTDESTRTVIQIDPAADKVVGQATVGNGPTGIAYGDGAVWVANALDDNVTQIDATTLTQRAVIPVADGPSAVAFGDGSVWVSAEFGDRVVRIDPKTATIVGSIPIGNRPEGLAAGAGGVWVAAQSSGQGHYGGRLVVIDTSNLDSIDPAIADTIDSGALIAALYDGLTNTPQVGGSAGIQPIPDLAAALPAPTDGGLSYTFHLRPGIRYSNGTPLRAEDFRRALEREFFVNGPNAASFASVVGAEKCKPHRACDLSRGMIVSGPSTLTIRLSAPDPTLFFDLTGLVPVPAGTPLKDVGTKAVPSTGTYKIQSYAPGRLLTIVRNPYFHLWSQAARPRGYPDEIDYRILKNPERAVHDVLTGKADLLTEMPDALVPELAARYPQLLHRNFQLGTIFAFLNVRRPPFNDLRVRQALNDAVDRKQMTVLAGGTLMAQPTCQLIPPTVQGYVRDCPYTIDPDPNGDWSGPDLARARALIAASHTRGQSIVVWTTRYFRGEGLYLVALLHRLGYRARLHYISDYNAYSAKLAKTPSAQTGIDGWLGVPTAAGMFESVGCRLGSNNWAHFCNRRIDSQVARLAEEQPSPAYKKLAAKIDRELVKQAPWVPLFTPRLADLASPRVGNYQASPYGSPLFGQMWVK